MLTSRKAFDGETVTDILSAIVRAEPDWTMLPKDLPPQVRRLLRRCLEKDRRRQLRDAGAVLLELQETPDHGTAAPVTTFNRERWVWIAAVVFVSAFGLALVIARRSTPAAPEMRLEITTPPTTDPVSLAISPDGQKIVFAATAGNRPQLWVRPLGAVSAQPLPGSDGGVLVPRQPLRWILCGPN